MSTTDLSAARDHDSVPATEGWRTSSFCGPNGGNCVEVNRGVDAVVGVADSKPAQRSPLTFGTAQWAGFLSDTRAGRFDA
jgi:Domain of unknown function (DUF397)